MSSTRRSDAERSSARRTFRRAHLKTRALFDRVYGRARRLAAAADAPRLATVRRRLELYVSALYRRPIAIQPAPEPKPSVYERVAQRLAPRISAAPGNDGERITLPSSLPRRYTGAAALALYRVMALEQAERIVRATRTQMPRDDAVARDLFLLSEATAIDAAIVDAHPPLRPVLDAERRRALSKRPWIEGLTRSERAVETLVRASLSGAPDAATQPRRSPDESLAWARETAPSIRALAADYRGVAPATSWGRTDGVVNPDARSPEWRREHARPMEHIQMRKFTGGRTAANSEAAVRNLHDDAGDGRSTAAERTNSGQGTLDPGDARRAPPAPGARAQNPHGSPDAPAPRPDWQVAEQLGVAALPPALRFDEWDADAGAYRRGAAAVRIYAAAAGAAMDEAIPAPLRPMIADARRALEARSARRVLAARQTSGDEIDLPAWIEAAVDRRLGRSPDDRVYRAVRRARRPLAIALLVDASGSTVKPLGDGSRIIDVERCAMVVAGSALDALGDPYAVYAFAGTSIDNVAVTPIKAFRDAGGALLRRRAAPLEPGGFTRLGAAVRYVSAELVAQPAGHRVLLLVSDGRPNDVDRYQAEYGIEDARRAVLDARAMGVHPFCLTIDPEGAAYLAHIFGPAGYTIVTHPDQLSRAIVHALQTMVAPA